MAAGMGAAPRHLRTPGTLAGRLHIEAELDHVTVLHDVVLALDAGLPRGARGGDGPGGDKVVVGHDLGLDETALEVAVDHPGRLGRRRPDADRPGPGFLWPGGQ